MRSPMLLVYSDKYGKFRYPSGKTGQCQIPAVQPCGYSTCGYQLRKFILFFFSFLAGVGPVAQLAKFPTLPPFSSQLIRRFLYNYSPWIMCIVHYDRQCHVHRSGKLVQAEFRLKSLPSASFGIVESVLDFHSVTVTLPFIVAVRWQFLYNYSKVVDAAWGVL